MAIITIFPRLTRLGVSVLLAEKNFARQTLHERMIAADPFLSYASSGGTRVTTTELVAIREALVAIAHAHGFPDTGSQVEKAEFDLNCAIWLNEQLHLSIGEGLRDDIWAFFSTCLLPDISTWRFGSSKDRFFGGVRNVFQRLWIRSHALDRGKGHPSRWEILQTISEDAAVQIIERPSIAASKSLSLGIGEVWTRMATEIGLGRMESVTRDAIRRIRIANEVLYFASLDSETLRDVVASYFRDAAQLDVETMESASSKLQLKNF